MPKTAFVPLKHGFHFGNNFVNKIINTSFGKIESRGRCGGMAYASLDYFFSGIPVPSHESKDFPNGMYPPDGSLLSDYIYERTINSLFTLYSFKFFDWTVQKDNEKSMRKSVGYKTKIEEFPKLKKSIDMGNPVVLGLIGARKATDITKNHQVVAYGYESDSDIIKVYIYDSNFPDKEVTLESSCYNCNIKSSTGQEWRGFFVQEYHAKKPKYIEIETKTSTEESLVKYLVKNIGQYPSNIKYLDIPEQIKTNKTTILPGETIELISMV